MSSLCVEASRIETHSDRLIELKRLVVQLDDYRFETLKYLCAHFRRVAAKCDINKVYLLHKNHSFFSSFSI
jgi:hypothetical protein